MLLVFENVGLIYEKVCKYKFILLIEDLVFIKCLIVIEKGLLEYGICSIMVVFLLN